MRIFHTADLHIGKTVHGISMAEEQKNILNEIISLADEYRPDAVIIAGDVYDRAVPPSSAVPILDNFLTELIERGTEIMLIAGNHDDARRLSFASRILEGKGIHIRTEYAVSAEPLRLSDEYGAVNFYLLPYLKPAYLRQYYEEEITDYDCAVKKAISEMKINTAERNVIAAHQFVTGAETSESEIRVGGVDNVSADAFLDFDYAALGHIHNPQHIKSEHIRYSGTPLKYSFSETEKSITMIDLFEKGNIKITELPLAPMHDMIELKGEYAKLVSRDFHTALPDRSAYISAILTDEDEEPYAIDKLREIYPNIMCLTYDNKRMRSRGTVGAAESKSIEECFSELYELQNGEKPSAERAEYIKEILKESEICGL